MTTYQRSFFCTAASADLFAAMAITSPIYAQSTPSAQVEVQKAASAQKQPLLKSLKEFVNIETGSRDMPGLVAIMVNLPVFKSSLYGSNTFLSRRFEVMTI